jgi:beta propeller repeat protein
MVKQRFLLLAAGFVAACCSSNPVMVDSHADQSEERDIVDERGEDDGRDGVEEREEVEAELDMNIEHELDAHDMAGDLEPLDCVLPIRDCGEGCRQVTCAGVIYWSYSWDVSGSYVAYFDSLGRDITDGGLNIKNLDDDIETVITEYPDLHYDSQEVVMEGPFIAYKLTKTGDTPDCRGYLRWIDTRTFMDDVAFCYQANPDGEWFFFNSLDIYNDLVVWAGHDEGEAGSVTDLFTFDLSAMQMTRLTQYEGVHYDPRIWEMNIVYEKYYSGSIDIFLMDIDTGEKTNLTANPSDQWDPDIWQDRVVWADQRNGPGSRDSPRNTDIYWCELPGCESRPATTNTASQMNPTLEGDWVAWIDYRNAEDPQNPYSFDNTREELWGYNTSTGEEYMFFSWENTLIHPKLRIENGKLYFLMSADTSCLYGCDSAVFEIDLNRFI